MRMFVLKSFSGLITKVNKPRYFPKINNVNFNFNYSAQQFFCNKITNENTPTLDEEIIALKKKIEGYENEYDAAKTKKEKKELLAVITTARSNLDKLYQKESSPNVPPLPKLDFSFKTSVNFPKSNGGLVIFKRDWFINKTVDMVTQQEEFCYNSYYWRAPAGSGKTVFLKLIGKKLQEKGFDVYYIDSAKKLDDYHYDYFTKLAKDAGNKSVALLIDEIQSNKDSKYWPNLLKDQPPNLLVLGVGIPQIAGTSPQFCKTYPDNNEKFPMFLTEEDLEEICEYFESQQKTEPKVSSEDIKNVCKNVLDYTAGQLYPFVKYVEYFLETKKKDILDDVGHHFTTKDFKESKVHMNVKERCFKYFQNQLICNNIRDMLLNRTPKVPVDLSKLSLSYGTGGLSPLLISEIFLRCRSSVEPKEIITIDDNIEKEPHVQQIISAGLREMDENDFREIFYDTDRVENALGHRWRDRLKATIPTLWIDSQVRTKYDEVNTPGAKPTIDFFVNGKYNFGLELGLNLNQTGIKEHLDRFNNKYIRFQRNGYVFNFDTEKESHKIGDFNSYEDDRVYTFVKYQNALYRGKKLVKEKVSINLTSPPLILSKS